MKTAGKMLLVSWIALSILSAQNHPQGTVHIYRYRLTVATAAHPTVSCDAFPVVRIQNGRVYTMKVSAGRHAFTVGDKSTGIAVDVESGKEYFVLIDYPPNNRFVEDPKPVLVPPEQGRMDTRILRPLDARFIEAATCGNP